MYKLDKESYLFFFGRLPAPARREVTMAGYQMDASAVRSIMLLTRFKAGGVCTRMGFISLWVDMFSASINDFARESKSENYF